MAIAYVQLLLLIVMISLLFSCSTAAAVVPEPGWCWPLLTPPMATSCRSQFMAAYTQGDPNHLDSGCCHTILRQSGRLCKPWSGRPEPNLTLHTIVRYCRGYVDGHVPAAAWSSPSSSPSSSSPHMEMEALRVGCFGELVEESPHCVSEVIMLEYGMRGAVDPRCCPSTSAECMPLLTTPAAGLLLAACDKAAAHPPAAA